MNLYLDEKLGEGYHSKSQKARVMTEGWAEQNMFCPRCNCDHINHLKNNQKARDFYCPECNSEYELKSHGTKFGFKVINGAYEALIQRLNSNNNPDFLFLNYSMKTLKINELILVPKYFLVADLIEKKRPLPPSARRAGWIGSNILLGKIPPQGRIKIISNGIEESRAQVIEKVRLTRSLMSDNLAERAWQVDLLNCLNQIPANEFTLNEMYSFEGKLAEKHPNNHHIQAKIRQQLQILRDRGLIQFLGQGKYRKLSI